MMRSRVIALAAALSVAVSAHGSVATGSRAAAATPLPLVTRVALSTLRSGGSAADAAISAALAMSVAHPQEGILGGGGFLLYFEKHTGSVWALEFRESAPRTLPKKADGVSANVGVPASVAGLSAAHARFGKLPWKSLFEDAISLARAGITVDAALSNDLTAATKDVRSLDKRKENATLYPNGLPPAAGSTLVQETLARTLVRVSERGPRDFYDGSFARGLVNELRQGGSEITLGDLKSYQAVWRAPIRVDYADEEFYAPPPPSRCGFIVAQALGALKTFDLTAHPLDASITLHLMGEVLRKAEAEARNNVGDPLRIRNAYAELLSTAHLEALARSIDEAHATPVMKGAPSAARRSIDIVTADEEGNVAALTVSIGPPFGNGSLNSQGFFMNTALADFDEPPNAANKPEGGMRPASLHAPMLVLAHGVPVAVIAAGNDDWSNAVLMQLFIANRVYAASWPDAIDSPRFWQSADTLHFERASSETLKELEGLGHAHEESARIGAVQAIIFGDKRLTAISDSRSGGAAGGY